VFLVQTDFISFGYIPSSGIARSSSLFNFQRNIFVFHNDYTYISTNNVQGSLYFTSLLAIFCPFGNSHSYWGEMVLICISLMVGDFEHFFTCCWPFVCLLRDVYFSSVAYYHY
jgi:hypothetical protein